MKRKFEIPKSKLYAEKDYAQLLKSESIAGVKLLYSELEPITISDGQVCCFDVFSSTGSTAPFMQTFTADTAIPFYASVKNSNAEQRIAFAGLKFLPDEPVVWKLALLTPRDVIKLTGDDAYPVSVWTQSGFIGFSDSAGSAAYFSAVRASVDEHPLHNTQLHSGVPALVYSDASGAGSAAVFSSGQADARYPVYIGYTACEKPAAIVCDFLQIETPKKEKLSGSETFEFDVAIEQLYQNDPKLGADENNAAKWSYVLQHKSELDEPALCRAYARRGYALHSLGDLDGALSDYYAAMELAEKPENKAFHNLREWSLYDNAGTILKERGNIDEAKALFEKAKAVGDKFYSGAHINLIEIYLSEKNYEKAALAAQEMVSLRPLDPVSYIKSAEVCVAQSAYENAIVHYDTLINKFNWDEAIMEKTACLGLLGKYQDALETLETYIEENNPNEIYYHNKGFLQYKQGLIEPSYANLLRAYTANPEFAPTINLLIETDEMVFDYEKVVRWAGKFIELRPNSEYGFSVRAEAYARLGQYKQAQEDYEYIYFNISSEPDYLHRLTCASLRGGHISKTQKRIKKIQKSQPELYAHCSALVLAKQGKSAKAEQLFLWADLKSEEALCDLADFYTVQGNAEAAQNAINALFALAPKSVNLFLRRYNYAQKFKSPKDADEIINVYLDAHMRDYSDTASVKHRIKTIAERLL
ncbi:MAG: DUF4241 domain-containing protein [Firmicutes bacterium]|nr:DUF4241 domain-containing protein [Bacillota bacterium]